MTIDVRAACVALDCLPAELADVCRREAARRLSLAVLALDDGDDSQPPPALDTYAQIDGLIANARDWAFRAAAFEALWTRHAEINDEREAERNGGESPRSQPATPQSPVPPLSSQETSVTAKTEVDQ